MKATGDGEGAGKGTQTPAAAEAKTRGATGASRGPFTRALLGALPAQAGTTRPERRQSQVAAEALHSPK